MSATDGSETRDNWGENNIMLIPNINDSINKRVKKIVYSCISIKQQFYTYNDYKQTYNLSMQ